jgi:hypothetical protein
MIYDAGLLKEKKNIIVLEFPTGLRSYSRTLNNGGSIPLAVLQLAMCTSHSLTTKNLCYRTLDQSEY